jgi:hypothetical protein
MERRISGIGGESRWSVRLENGHEGNVDVVRDLWFDRDIDGRWLVWAQDYTSTPQDGHDDAPTGAIVVRNQDVSAFIEQLGRLLTDPVAFAHEPVFLGADGVSDTTGE